MVQGQGWRRGGRRGRKKSERERKGGGEGGGDGLRKGKQGAGKRAERSGGKGLSLLQNPVILLTLTNSEF